MMEAVTFDFKEKKNRYGGTLKIVAGGAWGDEGKGKIASRFSENANLVIRGNGGANAGHSVQHNGIKIGLHLIPGGIVYEKPICLLGQGMVIDLVQLMDEIELLEEAGVPNVRSRIKIAYNAVMVFPFMKQGDKLYEVIKAMFQNTNVGTTGRGIGPTYASLCIRDGLRFIDLLRSEDEVEALFKTVTYPLNELFGSVEGFDTFDEEQILEIMKEYCNIANELHDNMELYPNDLVYNHYVNGSNIVIEGAQAFRLDHHDPDYPNNTSSGTTTTALLEGAHCTPKMLTETVLIFKAHYSRVGNGPFITELPAHVKDYVVQDYDEPYVGDIIRERAHEYGVSTGRPRRVGWFDAVIAHDAAKAMDADYLCINHLDTIGQIGIETGNIKICAKYKYNGVDINTYPTDMCLTKKMPKPVYGIIDGGWKITPDMTTFELLPDKAKIFIQIIEAVTGIPVKYIGTGPNNEDLIVR